MCSIIEWIQWFILKVFDSLLWRTDDTMHVKYLTNWMLSPKLYFASINEIHRAPTHTNMEKMEIYFDSSLLLLLLPHQN